MSPRPENFLEIEPTALSLEAIQTPVPVIDLDVVERNVARLQAWCDRLGMANRPHIKTHKIAGLARYQIAMGAVGISVQKLGEAEVMAAHGIADLFLPYNIMGAAKLDRLAALMRATKIAVVADNVAMLEGLRQAAKRGGRPLGVFVECDTGSGRNGVQSPAEALGLARVVAATEGLELAGLMTYPKAGTRAAAAEFFRSAKALCEAAGLAVRAVTTGGSPDQGSDEGLDLATEYRAGTSVYYDRSLVARGAATPADCALTVHATIVSRPTATRAIMDAGSKSLTSDLLGLEGYGAVAGAPEAKIFRLDEEHGLIETDDERLKVGSRVRILPNHVCPVSNLFDRIYVARGERLIGAVAIDARGRVD
jgi:D-serine deaminase-like pyridoxal phosphate-dependent protein